MRLDEAEEYFNRWMPMAFLVKEGTYSASMEGERIAKGKYSNKGKGSSMFASNYLPNAVKKCLWSVSLFSIESRVLYHNWDRSEMGHQQDGYA